MRGRNSKQQKGSTKVSAHGSDSCKDTVMARQLLRNLRQCPVTGGRSTAMTEEQFEAACEYHQERNRTRTRNNPFAVRLPVERNQQRTRNHPCPVRLPVEHNWCATCRGTVRPRELRIVTLRQLKRAMAEGVTLCP